MTQFRTEAPIVLSVLPATVPFDRALLRAPGGFLWWYVDLVDDRGDGLVCIWSFGLPFLPGYTSAARRGTPRLPVDHPSLSLATYRAGRPDLYLLQTFAPEQARWDDAPEAWTFGRNRFTHARDGREHVVHARIDTPLPGSARRLTGEITVRGVARSAGQAADGVLDLGHDTTHQWSPMVGTARGTARLESGDGDPFTLDGTGYFDRNAADRPLDRLGLHEWTWGRVQLPDRLLIWYLNTPDAPGAPPIHIAVTITDDGRLEVARDVTFEPLATTGNLFGLRWPDRIRIRRGGDPWLDVTHRHLVDSGPFYARFLLDATLPDGTTVPGVGEHCRPDRIDLDAHRPLVRMRVHDTAGPNSLWLPLFAGRHETRVTRLLRSWLPGAPPEAP